MPVLAQLVGQLTRDSGGQNGIAIPISNLVSNEIYVHVKLIAYLISLKQYTGKKTLDTQVKRHLTFNNSTQNLESSHLLLIS